MGWLREFLPSRSLNSVRVRNFELCVEKAPGTRIIDQEPTDNGQKLMVRLAPDASLSPALMQMLNTSHVSIIEISTKEEAAYLEVHIT